MSIHTYVGARYVPRFVGTYNATQIYDALDVVDNGSGTSYIARKTVPAGTPLTDTDYWFVYGASSGAIIALQNDMIQAQNDIIALQNLTNRCLLLIGNSYVSLGAADKIKALFPKVYTYYTGGIGFAARTLQPVTFADKIDDALADPTLDPDEITDVLFVSAYGEAFGIGQQGYSTYKTACNLGIDSCKNKIRANFPNCKKAGCIMADSRGKAAFSDSSYTCIFQSHKMLKELCRLHDMEYMGWPGFNIMLGAGLFESDDIHPTAADGIPILQEDMKNFYLGYENYVLKEGTTSVPLYLATTPGTARFTYQLGPDHVNLQNGYCTITANETLNVAANALVCKLSDLTIPVPSAYGNLYFPTSIYNAKMDTRFGGIALMLKANSNGEAELYCENATQGSPTLAASNVKLTGLNSISYNL